MSVSESSNLPPFNPLRRGLGAAAAAAAHVLAGVDAVAIAPLMQVQVHVVLRKQRRQRVFAPHIVPTQQRAAIGEQALGVKRTSTSLA